MILHHGVAGASGNVGEPAPGLAVVGRFADPDLLSRLPELFSGIEQTAVRQRRWTVRAVHRNAVRRRPGHASSVERSIQVSSKRRRCSGVVRRFDGPPALQLFGRPAGRLLQDRFIRERREGGHQQAIPRVFPAHRNRGRRSANPGAPRANSRSCRHRAIASTRPGRTDTRVHRGRRNRPAPAPHSARRQCGPAMVILGLTADDGDGFDVPPRSGLRVEQAAAAAQMKSRRLTLDLGRNDTIIRSMQVPAEVELQ